MTVSATHEDTEVNVDLKACDAAWHAYVSQLSPDHPHRPAKPDAFRFGGDPDLADELAGLVLAGRKRATTSLPIEFTSLNEPLPDVGDVSIILRGDGVPVAIIERTQVTTRPFVAVDEAFAAIEGEGDGSLAYWRESHAEYFTGVCARLGGRFDAQTPVLCQVFRVVWKSPAVVLSSTRQPKERELMHDKQVAAPDNTAVRVALWRALHVELDSPPHVLEDEIGLKLAAPDDGWRNRPDMSPFTRPFRASIVARARFIEDLVAEQAANGVGQYVILGAGLDTFAQRRPELASRLLVFEIDRPGPQAWKRQRLVDLSLGIPSFLRLVPVDFEAGDAWWEHLAASGFDSGRPAVVASTGVSMYLTKDAIVATLRQVATLAPGSTLAMSFMLPIELSDPEVRPGIERAAAGARANGTPFISFFTPTEILTLARDAGFGVTRHVSAATLAQRYFAGRTDGLRPPNNSEELLVANT